MNPNDFCLGTAQLGQEYGPGGGVTDYGQARDIIAAFYEHGGRWFDTAAAYGKSEEWLGDALDEIVATEARVVTKVRADDPIHAHKGWHYLWHGDDFPDGVVLNGASVDSVEAATRAIGAATERLRYVARSEIIQVAASVFDRRMARAGIFEAAHAAGMTVFVRSIYLRGLAVMSITDAEEHTGGGARLHAWDRLFGWLYQWELGDISSKLFCYWYVRQMAPHAIPVIGCDSVEHVNENVRIATLFSEWDQVYPDDDPEVYDPRRWDEG